MDASTSLSEHHVAMLEASGITAEHAAARGYETITDARRLADAEDHQGRPRHVPGLLVPLLRVDGSTWGYQYRPDSPRLSRRQDRQVRDPVAQRNGSTCRPVSATMLGDPSVPLWITEGRQESRLRRPARAVHRRAAGVWGWRGTNTAGGKMALRRLARHRAQRSPGDSRVRRRRGTQRAGAESVARAGRISGVPRVRASSICGCPTPTTRPGSTTTWSSTPSMSCGGW